MKHKQGGLKGVTIGDRDIQGKNEENVKAILKIVILLLVLHANFSRMAGDALARGMLSSSVTQLYQYPDYSLETYDFF